MSGLLSVGLMEAIAQSIDLHISIESFAAIECYDLFLNQRIKNPQNDWQDYQKRNNDSKYQLPR
ncbi:MAG: hypothetical protein J7641_01740 [Cyanobacteria bacterium SID2]|nr:hypothetical protein [Cyanobacteria bacterium SID2]